MLNAYLFIFLIKKLTLLSVYKDHFLQVTLNVWDKIYNIDLKFITNMAHRLSRNVHYVAKPVNQTKQYLKSLFQALLPHQIPHTLQS